MSLFQLNWPDVEDLRDAISGGIAVYMFLLQQKHLEDNFQYVMLNALEIAISSTSFVRKNPRRPHKDGFLGNAKIGHEVFFLIRNNLHS